MGYKVTESGTSYNVSSQDSGYNITEVVDTIQTVDMALGTTEQNGAVGSDVYIASKILNEETWTEEISRTFPVKSLSINNKYLALSWADYFAEDETVMLPLMVKYDLQQSFYWQPKPMSDDYFNSWYFEQTPSRDPKNVEIVGSVIGEHLYLHWTFGQLCPKYDGRNTPSNDDLRVDRGDGCNEWGHDITNVVVDDLGYTFCSYYMQLEADSYNKQWQNLTDDECQQFRTRLSMFMTGPDAQNGQKMLEGLDYLSNYYLGTTGTSVYDDDYTTRLPGTVDGSEPSSINPILGGILQGATTTENHEFWERVLEISWRWKRDVHKVSRRSTYWVTSGGWSENVLYYKYGADRSDQDNCFVDREKTQIVDGEAKFYSEIAGETRSFNEVLRSKGYKITSAGDGVGVRLKTSTGMTRIEAQRIYKKNHHYSKADTLGDGLQYGLRIFDNGATTEDIETIMSGTNVVKDCFDLTATDARWEYDSAFGIPGKFSDFIIRMTTYIAWGMIPEGNGDTGVNTAVKRASMAMFIEALFQYCKLADITIIAHEQAYDLAFNKTYSPSNYFPNHEFETTMKDIIGGDNAPVYPDGWNGGAVIEETVDGSLEKCLHIDRSEGEGPIWNYIRQFAVKPGIFTLSLWIKGKGEFNIRQIKNNSTLTISGDDDYEDWLSMTIDESEWTEINISDTIPNAAIVDYDAPSDQEEKTTQYYLKGLDNKVCGIHIELGVATGNEIKISKPVITIT